MNSRLLLGLALGCALLFFGPARPALAQGTSSGPAAAPAQTETPSGAKPSRRSRSKSTGDASKKEPTVGQMAGRERMRRCAKEWKDMKAANKVESGMRWPKFFSQCNARLKEQKA